MNKKIIGIFACIIIITTALSVNGTINEKKINDLSSSVYDSWTDDFESYSIGQYLDGDKDDGGWKGWYDNSGLGAYVVDDESHSESKSVEVTGDSDLVHEFSGINSGRWNFITWQYIPWDYSGTSYFILLSKYEDNADDNNWAIQITFDNGKVQSSNGDTLDIIEGRWVELRAEINLYSDWIEFYYDSELLFERKWTEGVSEEDGVLKISAVDLYGSNSKIIYYDDFSLDSPETFSCDSGGPYEGGVDKTIQFKGTVNGGDMPHSYLWDFGDGETSYEKNPTHLYTTADIFTVTFTVSDDSNNIASSETTATIRNEAILEMDTISGGLLKAGVTIKNTGTADAIDVNWSILIYPHPYFSYIISGDGEINGVISNIPIGGEFNIKSNPIIGFGLVAVLITAEVPESYTAQYEEMMLLFIFLSPLPESG